MFRRSNFIVDVIGLKNVEQLSFYLNIYRSFFIYFYPLSIHCILWILFFVMILIMFDVAWR